MKTLCKVFGKSVTAFGLGGFFFMILLGFDSFHQARSEALKRYVGNEPCKACHEKEYNSFATYSKKNHSFKSIQVRKKSLNENEFTQCFTCHTTGYGQPGGFTSAAETPDLKNLGCEACHGPGSIHVQAGDPKEIKGKLTASDCESCHNTERVAAFNYRPMINGGAH